MHRNKSVDVHQFAMVPRAEIPRSSFRMEKSLKTSFDAGFLVPMLCEEVLPGDTFNLKGTFFCRLATPLFPIMDNLYLETFFFFVPNRLVWTNWVKFMGEQTQPTDSISFVIPQVVSPAGGYAIGSLPDYFGLPTVGQVAGANTVSHSVLPLRGYALIYDQWFRDENLQSAFSIVMGDGPDLAATYAMQRRGKRVDYFTGCLPNPQKGGTAISMPLSGNAPVIATGTGIPEFDFGAGVDRQILADATGDLLTISGGAVGAAEPMAWSDTKLVANLSAVTGATINQLRQSFQIQKLLERDARGGTRYTELVRSHFGVISPDARLQRPEYLGGGRTPVNISPIPQTSATSADGTDTPQGNLAAMGTALAHDHGFTQSFTEHGYVIGLCSVNADLTYSQGLRRHWSRSTRYDFYFPVFASLGEQAVLSKEIYCDGAAGDADVFGYQERWGEYRYCQSEITSLMRPTAAGTIAQWHLSQDFGSRPTLNATFISDTTDDQLERVLAVGSAAGGQQLLMDAFFSIKAARPMPLYSVPGLIDHF